MKIVSFTASNFQILRAVEIKPDGNIITIAGENGAGKSSILKAIWVAFVGRSVAGPKPIRAGEEKCIIQVETEEFAITRTFTAKDGGDFTDTLKVESLDGKTRFQRPQQTIDALLGEIGFDPFAFVLKKPEEQASILLGMVPLSIDIDELAQEDFSDRENRRDINRDVAALTAQVNAIPEASDLPAEPIDREAIVAALAGAAETNGAIERERRDREDTALVATRRREHGDDLRSKAKGARDEAERLIAEAERLENSAKADDADADRLDKDLAALPPLADPVDTAKLRDNLAAAESTNAKIAQEKRRLELVAERDAKAAESQALTTKLEEREKTRQDALAKAKMPIDGLAFAINDKGKPVVMFRGVPFEIASSADQIRASTAIAMAANPELRVMRIKDGSLLDSKSMAIISEMATENDWQVWVERVGDSGGVGFIIENGEIVGEPAVKEKAAGDDKPAGALL